MAVGKQTLVEQTWGNAGVPPAPSGAGVLPSSVPYLQRKELSLGEGGTARAEGGDAGAPAQGRDTDRVKAAAALGLSGTAGPLPYRDRIQAAFGRHDVSHVQAFVGGAAAEGAAQMGAQAFASGDKVAFRSTPDLHTAAHEAAHVVQQRAGVQLRGGVGEAGDAYERNADAVADQVVRGGSAESLLDPMAGGGGKARSEAVQRLIVPIGDLAPPDASLQAAADARIIDQSTRRLVTATGDRVDHLGAGGDGARRPLAALRNDEELQIVAHGGHPLDSQVAETYGGHSPAQLAQLLVANGLRRAYRGTIYLNGCNTATQSARRQSYAERFQLALRGLGIHAAVRGNQGGSRVLENGETGFRRDDPDSRRRIEEIELEMARLQDTMASVRRLANAARMPESLVGDVDALRELGLGPDATVEAISPALQKMAAERAQRAGQAQERVIGGLDSDALFERRPDLITTLAPPPRPASDNEILLQVGLVMLAAVLIAGRCPYPYNVLVMFLGVVISLAIGARAMAGRR